MVTLVACGHGTSDPVGRAAIAGLVGAVRERLRDVRHRVVDAFVDVQSPSPDDVVATLAGAPAVLVPILLSAGYHVHVDLARAAASGPDVSLARALGPDDRLADLLVRRLGEAGLRADDTVVLGAAGSSDARAVADVEAVAALVENRLGRPVQAAYASASRPRIADAVRGAREDLAARHASAGRVVVALYLLAPGHFADRAAACGADVVTAPLLVPGGAPPPELVDIVLERFYDSAESAQRQRNP